MKFRHVATGLRDRLISMAFIRRGYVKVRHKNSAFSLFHRIDGAPVKLPWLHINCWEEHQLPTRSKITTIYWGIASSTAVRETFDDIDAAINENEVSRA